MAQSVPRFLKRLPDRDVVVQKHIRLVAVFSVLAGLLFGSWGWVVGLLEPIQEPLWIRFLISALFVGFGFMIAVRKFTLRQIEWMFAVMSLFPTVYAFAMIPLVGVQPTWMTGTAIIIFGVLNFITYRGPIVLYISMTILFGVWTLPETEPGQTMNRWSILLNYGSAMFMGVYSSLLRYQLLIQGRSLESDLAIASRMSSLGEMAAGIAHEINNPLAVIAGRADLIKKIMIQRGISGPDLLTQVESISQTSHRMGKIITSMKALSRQSGADEFSEFSFETAWSDVISISQERLRLRGIKLEVEIESGVRLWGNSGQISQVVLNLLNNSIDAIEGLEERWIRIEGQRLGKTFVVRVTDSGNGIPLEVQRRLMQPFFTTKEVGKGTGLGLSLAKSILDQHRGSFELNRDSKNTQFVLSLPIHELERSS